MRPSTVAAMKTLITAVAVTEDRLTVEFTDRRTMTDPLSWHPRLCHGNADERADWRLIGRGQGIHWPQLDEDISAETLILGQPSTESQISLKKWLESRTERPPHA